MRLEKFRRNQIIEIVGAAKIVPTECIFDFDDAVSRITHVPSQSYFLLMGEYAPYTATAVVGESPGSSLELLSWSRVEQRVQHWAEAVKRDVDTPDLWAEVKRNREILTAARYDEVENTAFTSEEQAEIAEQIRQVTEFVRTTYSLHAAQMESLEAKLDDIAAAATRTGRRDWQLLFYGVMFNTIVAGLLAPDAALKIILTVGHALGHLFGGGGGGPPQLPPMT